MNLKTTLPALFPTELFISTNHEFIEHDCKVRYGSRITSNVSIRLTPQLLTCHPCHHRLPPATAHRASNGRSGKVEVGFLERCHDVEMHWWRECIISMKHRTWWFESSHTPHSPSEFPNVPNPNAVRCKLELCSNFVHGANYFSETCNLASNGPCAPGTSTRESLSNSRGAGLPLLRLGRQAAALPQFYLVGRRCGGRNSDKSARNSARSARNSARSARNSARSARNSGPRRGCLFQRAHIYIYIFIYLFIYLFCLFIHLFIYLSDYPFIYCIYLFTYFIFIYFSFFLFIDYLFICMYLFYLFIYLSIYLFVYLFVYLFIYLFVCLFVYLFIHLFIYLFECFFTPQILCGFTESHCPPSTS